MPINAYTSPTGWLQRLRYGLSAGHPKELVSGTRLGSPLLPTSEGPGIDGASLPPVEDFQLRLARRLRSLPNWRDRSVKDLDEGPELSFEWIASQATEAWQWKNEYRSYIRSYVKTCPFHLFDIELEQLITRDILAIRMELLLRDPDQVWVSVLRPVISQILDSIENQREDFRYLENSIAEFIEKVADCPGDVTRPELAVYLPPNEKNSRYLRATLNHLFNLTIHARRTVIEMVGRYAILSHRWEGEDQELTFDCLKYFSERSVMGRKHGFAKLRGFCEVAASYRCRFVWIDSGCINRKDHGELEVSISSMYEWYRNAYVTVAYLRETHQPQVDVTFNAMLFSQISRDPWFRRGWTLQEYYAPQRLRFYYGDWELCPLEIGRDQAMRLGDAAFGFEDDPNVLSMFMDANTSHPMKILKAMHARETSLPEDMAYCLYSILGVELPIAYGEGYELAFYRLQVALVASRSRFNNVPYENYQLLMWRGKRSRWNTMISNGHKSFSSRAKKPITLPCERPDEYPEVPVAVTVDQNILSIQMTLVPIQVNDDASQKPMFVVQTGRIEVELDEGVVVGKDLLLGLSLGLLCGGPYFFGIILRKISNDQAQDPTYERIGCLISHEGIDFDEALRNLPSEGVRVQ